MTYLFAVLAAIANAVSSVLQRKAERDEPSEHNLSWRLIVDVLHRPAFFGGILGIIAGFLLQAAALSSGALSVVEPILVFELPVTLLLAGVVFGQRLHRREWLSAGAITVGLAALLYFLAPSQAPASRVSALMWAVAIAVTVAVIAVLIAVARRGPDNRRAALLGVATGAAFGLTAALIKSVTDAFTRHGFVGIFTTWQTYAMIVAGILAVFVLQSALNAGPLVAAQPGITGSDPIVSILWGTLVFGETVRTGWYVIGTAIAAAVIAAGIVGLSRSPLVSGDNTDNDSSGEERSSPPSASRKQSR